MIRKVIKQAGQAYTITLPIEWVRENNIEKNNEIDLEIQDKSIVIKNTHGVSVKKASIVIDEMERFTLGRQIHALYAKGLDEIQIVSKQEISSAIIDILGELIGFALVSQEKNIYVIKDIGGGNYSDLDEIFKRVFQMVLMFYDAAINDIFSKQTETMAGVDGRDEEINKFCLFLQRAINKMSYSDPVKGRILFTYSFVLEQIGDEMHRLWRFVINEKIKNIDKLKDLFKLSKEGLDLAFDYFYTNNIETAEKIHKIKWKVRKEAASFADVKLSSITRHAIKIIENAADLNHLSMMMRDYNEKRV